MQVKTVSRPQPLVATLTDLSISGGLITADSEFARPGETIAIAFSFRVKPTNQEMHIQAHATVRSCQRLHGNLPDRQFGTITFSHGIGIHFEDIAPKDLVMLQHYIYEQVI